MICYDYDTTNKYVETMFPYDKSPGKSFFRIKNSVTVTKVTNDEVTLTQHNIFPSVKEMDEMSTYTVSESSLTKSMIKVLESNGLNLLSLNNICSNYCPFSGGGDIAFFSFDNSAVVAIQQINNDRPDSPPADGEVKVSFDIELKRSEQSSENLVKQLLANMMVVAAMSLEKVCLNRVQSEIKSISTYGLSVDLILPLRLFKLTIDFDRNCVVIINKHNVELGIDSFLKFDKLLTFMIRNCVHNTF